MMPGSDLSTLETLVGMSRRLGEPERDLVILGDGNTSALINEETFWVKASGAMLHGIQADGFTRMRFAPILELLDKPPADDGDMKRLLAEARVDPQGRHPSIETVFHALALTVCQAKYVAHTHPISINAILCARGAREALSGHLFSESALYLGPEPVIIEYADPGLPAARSLLGQIQAYMQRWGSPPRVFYLLNHGMVALGQTALEVENITAMAVKSARILLGTYAAGGPKFISDEDVRRIVSRPDEEYRRKLANKGL
jgi:rhamnose utilization protein RhaD (predicted bifunctional aldolase and dehydrogenase)